MNKQQTISRHNFKLQKVKDKEKFRKKPEEKNIYRGANIKIAFNYW